MKYKIPKKILNIIIGENYSTGEYTLKQELDRYKEEIIYADYATKEGKLIFFNAWSKDRVFFLAQTDSGDGYLLTLSRSPEIYKERKKKDL
jgi:hypothetical protein